MPGQHNKQWLVRNPHNFFLYLYYGVFYPNVNKKSTETCKFFLTTIQIYVYNIYIFG
jgi:hypothetical protein